MSDAARSPCCGRAAPVVRRCAGCSRARRSRQAGLGPRPAVAGLVSRTAPRERSGRPGGGRGGAAAGGARAAGARGATGARSGAGASMAIVPAALGAVLLERLVLGPEMGYI